MSEPNLFFALDIGTRSVVGLVADKTGETFRILACERMEHRTRSMLDGQIHDVREVAKVIQTVKERLEIKFGKLEQASVAAAGRALYTTTVKTSMEVHGRGQLTQDDERALELAAIQEAQHRLTANQDLDDPANYYCVGYSVVSFQLDGQIIRSVVGQRARMAEIEIIATFLPRQVINSLEAALAAAGLTMASLTLEPIAAINVLIPTTMRHLNLALVDVGAGTSDVAITKQGSVVGYGMVPCAGDEITEALSRRYLLDFHVAEKVKRQLHTGKRIAFTDILGVNRKLPASEIIDALMGDVGELASAIANQVQALNAIAPQAILLVGGGALTPGLSNAIADVLGMPSERVAVRRPDSLDWLEELPHELRTPDAVTPLGILKVAGSTNLNFIEIFLNEDTIRLFDLGHLTVSDALLAAGLDIRGLHGRPGLGITITVNGETRFLPGTLGTPVEIFRNDCRCSLSEPLRHGDKLSVRKGSEGQAPIVAISDIISLPGPKQVFINGQLHTVRPHVSRNGQEAKLDETLVDRDVVEARLPNTVAEVLSSLCIPASPQQISLTVNRVERSFTVWPRFLVNGETAHSSTPVIEGDQIEWKSGEMSSVAALFGIDAGRLGTCQVSFNGTPCQVPTELYSITINGMPASLSDIPAPGSVVECTRRQLSNPMISDVLLAASIDPRGLPLGGKVDLLLNGRAAEYISPVKNGDSIELSISGPTN